MPETKVYYLIGMMGVGKSSIGSGAARKLGFSFIDLDDHICKCENRTIKEIFQNEGESAFRDLEKKYLRSLNLNCKENVIVSTGGGAPAYNENMDYMNDTGRTIWLQTPINQIVKRLKDEKNDRPLINLVQETELATQLRTLYDRRLPHYDKAHLKLENAGSRREVINKLVDLINIDVKN